MFGKDATCTLTPAEINRQAADLLARLTLKEKVWLLNGNWDVIAAMMNRKGHMLVKPFVTNGAPRLGIPPIRFADGPRGVVLGQSTAFPVTMARGASFDRDLERRIGDAIGKELRAQGANYYGGVCVNLLRHPAWGRAQETYGEDPFHLGEMGVELVRGVQAHNVMACVKHFALNNIENSRFFVDVQIADRVLHEVYLPHFKKIVQAGVASVMGAYNRVNGAQACESRTLLTEILRDDWGFAGFTLSDFIFGIRDGEKAIQAGMDVEMPFPLEYQRKLLAAVQGGRVPQAAVDAAALRVLRTQLVFQHTPDPMHYDKSLVACPAHVSLAQEAAEKAMVLLKNEGNVLPLSKPVKRVLVLGRLADQPNTGDHGSSWVHAPHVVTPLEGLAAYLGDGVEITHYDESQIEQAKSAAPLADCVVIVAGYDFNDEGEFLTPDNTQTIPTIARAYRNMAKPLQARLVQVMAKFTRTPAQKADGSPMGGDRRSLGLKPEQRRLIEAVAPLNPHTIVCLVTGSMILMEEWAEQVPAVLYAWYAGMAGGTALARILFGEVNPSGKLPFTIPTRAEHLPYFSSTDRTITYDLYHGYTLLDKCSQTPAYPFGFGLSYTTFAYSDLAVEPGDGALIVHVKVTNTGPRDGEEVVQVYVGMESSHIERPKKLLKGFARVALPAGQSEAVTITVPVDELRYYDAEARAWRLEPGVYQLMAGPSSTDEELLKASVRV